MGELNYTDPIVIGENENFTKVQQHFEDIKDWADGNVSDDNFAATFSHYASWQTIYQVDAVARGMLSGGARVIGRPATSVIMNSSGGNITVLHEQAATDLVRTNLPLFQYADEDYAAAGRTQQRRIRVTIGTNSVSPNMELVISYQNSGSGSGGAADELVYVGDGTVGIGAVVVFDVGDLPANSVVTKTSVPRSITDDRVLLTLEAQSHQNTGSVMLISAEIQRRMV